MGLTRGWHVDAADLGRGLRADDDQTFLAQPHQGVADGRLADAEALGQLAAVQRAAWRQLQGNDGGSKCLDDLGRRMAGGI